MNHWGLKKNVEAKKQQIQKYEYVSNCHDVKQDECKEFIAAAKNAKLQNKKKKQ